MKKKLISLFLIVSLFSFVFSIEVKAVGMGDSFSIAQNGTKYQGLVTPGGSTLTTYEYTATSGSNSYVAYCIDPHMQFNGGTTYTVKTNENNEYLAGVSAIISGNGGYEAKEVAIRAFTYGFMKLVNLYSGSNLTFSDQYGTPGVLGNGYKTSVFVNLGIQWACNSANSSYASQLGVSGNCASTLQSATSMYTGYDPNASASGSSVSTAESLFNQAMAAAANAKNGNSSSESEGGFSLNASLGDVAVNESTVEITATFDFEGATVNDYIKNINFQLNGSGYELSTIEYTSNGETNTLENNSETNIIESLVSSLEDGATTDGTVTLKITLNKTFTDEEECEPATFTISYLYSGSKAYDVVVLKSNVTNQDMLIVGSDFVTGEPSEPSENDGTLEGEIPCEEGEEEVCGTYITTPICSDNEEESTSDIVAPEDIKKCILDNVDDTTENTYKLASAYGGLEGNEYCDVFCKEDYKDVLNSGDYAHGIILQPKIDDVVCGGYFQLKAHIEGAKDCYTGGDGTEDSENGLKSIDKEKYLEEIQSIENNMVDAITRYNEATIALEQLENAEITESTFSCNGQTITNYTVNVESSEYTGFTFEWNEEDESGTFEETQGNTESLNVRDNQTCAYDEESESYYVDGEARAMDEYNALQDRMQTQQTTAKSEYDTAVEEYRENISMYNECVTGWTMTYDFAHTLRYYYDETYEENGEYVSTIPYYSLIKDNADNTVMVPDEENGVYEYLVDVEVCKETATNEYKCEGTSSTFDNFDEDDVGQTNISEEKDVIGTYAYGYDERYANAFEKKNYVLCKIDGDGEGNGEGICDNDTRNISQASFVRKSIKKAQDYISPSVFWQSEVSGKITASEVEGTESLEHKLPVSSRSVLGGTFRLILEDLGEFYDPGDIVGNDKYGRLIDIEYDRPDLSNYDKSVAKALGYDANNGFDGTYECYYVNNCKPDDCPNCEFVPSGVCPNCNFTPTDVCINCIFNLDELQINVKPITNTEVKNPSRDYGYNWITDTNYGRLELISQKAEQTINEIQEQNDLIYSSTKVTDDNGLAFSINLTPSIISYLKEYNAAAEEKGGYGNDSLTCEDATFGETTKVENLFCYSEVISELVNNDNYNHNIPDLEAFTKKRSNASTYWTTFPNWEQIVGDELTDAGQSYVIGGPAWK